MTRKPETGCKSPTDPPASPHPNLKCKHKPTYRQKHCQKLMNTKLIATYAPARDVEAQAGDRPHFAHRPTRLSTPPEYLHNRKARGKKTSIFSETDGVA